MSQNIVQKYIKDYDNLDRDTKYKIYCEIEADLNQNYIKNCYNCNKSPVKKDNLCTECLITSCVHYDKKHKYILFTRKTLDGVKFCTYCTKTFLNTKGHETKHLCFEKNTHILQSYDRMFIDYCEVCDERYLMCSDCFKRICNCGLCKSVCTCEYRYKK